MKKIFLLLIISLASAGFASAQIAQGGTLYVAVKTVTLKSSTGFFSSNRGTLNYGDAVTVLQVSGKFVEVKSVNSSVTGWTATANMSARQIVSGNATSLSAKETALAGKGFTQEVEDAYKTKGAPNYTDVDRVEAIKVTETGLKGFLEEGHLSTGE